MLKFFKKDKGFTLIELLVVIAIISVLASIVLVSLNTARIKGRDARRVADIKSLQVALELYYDSVTPNAYPAALTSLVPTYIPAIPKDPKDGSTNYRYTVSGTAHSLGADKAYHLAAKMEGIDGAEGALASDTDQDVSTANVWATSIDGSDAATTVNSCDTPADATLAALTDNCYDVTN